MIEPVFPAGPERGLKFDALDMGAAVAISFRMKSKSKSKSRRAEDRTAWPYKKTAT
jgi:hypothetical protein